MSSAAPPPAWTADALCAQIGGDAWFPGPNQAAAAQEAKRLCQQCPVIEECLSAALAVPFDYDYGIWGGTGRIERRNMRDQATALKPIRHGTRAGYRAHGRRGEQACAECLNAERIKHHGGTCNDCGLACSRGSKRCQPCAANARKAVA